jgi:transcription elongation factor GreA
LPPDDLKTAILTDLDRLKELAKEDPVALVVMALTKAGGEGGNSEVRRLLVPEVVAPTSWAAWWKRALTASERDARIDTSQIFRKILRVRGEGGNGALLPPIQEKSDLHQNVENVRRFLVQHPDSAVEARRSYRPRLLQWLGSSHKPEARAHLLSVLRLWEPGLEREFRASVKDLLDAGGDFLFTSLESEQLDFLEAGEAAGVGVWAAVASLPSRSEAVRTRAVEILRADPELDLTRFTRDLYSRSPHNAGRILGLVEFALSYPDAVPLALEDPWLAARAVIAIVHGAPKEPLRRWALGLVKPAGPFALKLREKPIDDEGRMLLEQALIQWRTTDRHLFPVLEFLEAAGANAIVAEVQRDRSVRSAELVAKARMATELETGALMSRAGLERLRDEIIDIETTLKTTLPETIRRAMALGDLKENAEYHAAKEKQRQLGERISRLRETIGHAKAIEDLSIEEGVAGPGTEVVARDVATGHDETFWILGEGDSFHGAHVITYSAPLGWALRGKREGDEVTVRLDGGERRLRILSVRTKLPAAATPPRA